MLILRSCVIALFIILPSLCFSEPTVIYDNKEVSQPIDKYNRVFQKTEAVRRNYSGLNYVYSLGNQPSLVPKKQALDNSNKPEEEQRSWLPIKTTELTIGDVETKEVYFPNVQRPICVIGNDKRSLEWFANYKNHLKKVNAYCWLIQVDDHEDIRRISRVTKGVQVVPANGKILNTLFGIKKYPILITARQVVQ